jgi:hypothetical protein
MHDRGDALTVCSEIGYPFIFGLPNCNDRKVNLAVAAKEIDIDQRAIFADDCPSPKTLCGIGPVPSTVLFVVGQTQPLANDLLDGSRVDLAGSKEKVLITSTICLDDNTCAQGVER